MKKHFFLLLILFAGVLVTTHIFQESRYHSLLTEKSAFDKPKTIREVVISKGQSLREIASVLKEQDLIIDEDVFIRYVGDQGKSTALQAGTFSLPTHITTPEVLSYLIGATKPEEIRITIPEGSTITWIANLYESRGLGSKEEFLDCIETCTFRDDLMSFFPKSHPQALHRLEGYLFPDTYFVPATGTTPQKFIEMMLVNFQRRVIQGLEKEIASSKYTLEEAINMASIVERESSPRDDRSIIAGILWKRLENNVQLAADATTVYLKGDTKAPLTVQDLRSTNPYNTRMVKGLPPTPISNPGLASIKGSLAPSESPYWYYLHDNNGTIHFAATEREHNQNKRLYLQ